LGKIVFNITLDKIHETNRCTLLTVLQAHLTPHKRHVTQRTSSHDTEPMLHIQRHGCCTERGVQTGWCCILCRMGRDERDGSVFLTSTHLLVTSIFDDGFTSLPPLKDVNTSTNLSLRLHFVFHSEKCVVNIKHTDETWTLPPLQDVYTYDQFLSSFALCVSQ
jgi:hypothetical protein